MTPQAKTLAEIKDEIGFDLGYGSWNNIGIGNIDPIVNMVAERYAAQFRNEWISARNDNPVLTGDFTYLEVLADTGEYNNYEVVLFDGTDYFDKHRNDETGNPLEITDKVERWKYINPPEK